MKVKSKPVMSLRSFFFLFLAFPILAHAVEIKDFRGSVEIGLTPGKQLAHVIVLPPEIAAKVQGAGEVRVVDANGKMVPYMLRFAHEQKIRKREIVSVFNAGMTPDRYQSFELEIPPADELVSRLELLVEDNNFSRVATLLARGSTSEAYQIVKEGMRIVRMTSEEDGISYSHTSLQVPPQAKRFFQVQIALGPDEQPLKIEGVRVWQEYDVLSRRQTVALEIRGLHPEELQELSNSSAFRHQDFSKRSLYLLTNPFGEIALDTFELQVDGDQFARRVRLLTPGRKSLHPLTRRGTASIFKYGPEQNLSIELGSAVRSERYLLDIDHGDNLPFDLTSASGFFISTEVLFLHDAANPIYKTPFRLYFDTDHPEMPSFDIATAIKKKGITSFEEATLSRIERNSEFVARDTARKQPKPQPALLYVAVGLLVLILLWYLVRLAQAGSPSDSN